MIKHIFTLIWNKKGSNALILLEILLAFIVLFAVLSFVFYNTDRLDDPLGFETENRKYIRFGHLESMNDSIRDLTMKELKRSLEDMELVEHVGFGHDVGPFLGSNWCSGNDDLGYEIQACYSVVDYDFIEANGMNIIEGRGFSESDLNSTYQMLIGNQTFMTKTFGEKSMIDSIIPFQGNESKIIGVVDEYKYDGEFKESENALLILSNPKFNGFANMTSAYLKMSPTADIAYEEKISKLVESIIKTSSFSIQDAPLLRKRANLQSWIPIVALLSMCVFLCVNVALGLFGVLSYSISKRRAEVGLRRALGAHAGSIIQQFTLEVILLASLALIVGVFFALQIPLLKVVDVNPTIFYRGIVYATVIIMAVIGVCALYPSIQASRIHPATALHED